MTRTPKLASKPGTRGQAGALVAMGGADKQGSARRDRVWAASSFESERHDQGDHDDGYCTSDGEGSSHAPSDSDSTRRGGRGSASRRRMRQAKRGNKHHREVQGGLKEANAEDDDNIDDGDEGDDDDFDREDSCDDDSEDEDTAGKPKATRLGSQVARRPRPSRGSSFKSKWAKASAPVSGDPGSGSASPRIGLRSRLASAALGSSNRSLGSLEANSEGNPADDDGAASPRAHLPRSRPQSRRESSVSSGSLGAGLRAGWGSRRRPSTLKIMNWKSFSSSNRSLTSSDPPEEERYRHEECVHCSFEVQEPTLAPCGHVFCRHCAWDRVIVGPPKCPVCEEPLSPRSLSVVAKHTPLEPNPLHGIFDSVFIEFGRLGFKSFHFSRNRCYINYGAPDGPEEWKTFDDGTPAPRHKDFDSFSYDDVHRVFHGTIKWSPKTWSGGVAKVNYELIFDDSYEYICDGTAVAFNADGSVHGLSRYGTDAKYRRLKPSIYTTDSVYLWDSTRPLLDSTLRRGFSPYKGVLRFTRWVAKTTMGIPNWMFQELMSDNVGLYGVGSLHFSEAGSFINLSNVRGHSLPAAIPFTVESYNETTRVFEGDFDFDPYWFSGDSAPDSSQHSGPLKGVAHCYFVFDRELGKIVSGHVRFYRRMETGSRASRERHYSLGGPPEPQPAPRSGRGGCLAAMFGACARSPPPEVVQERLQLMRSIELGKDICFRLKNPWQTLTRRVYNMPHRNLMAAEQDAEEGEP